jgi:hypothetical protein
MAKHKYDVVHHRRKNPLGISGDDGMRILWGSAGYIAARAVPAMVLPSQNSGWIGYALNAGTALLMKLLIGGSVGEGLFIGGAVATVTRIVSDQLGTKIAGLSGDPAFTLGAYWQSTFPIPTVSDPYGRTLASPWPAPVVAAPATMKGLALGPRAVGGRFTSGRFG